MLARCVSIVRRDRNSCSAISPFVCPSASSRRISCSRGVSRRPSPSPRARRRSSRRRGGRGRSCRPRSLHRGHSSVLGGLLEHICAGARPQGVASVGGLVCIVRTTIRVAGERSSSWGMYSRLETPARLRSRTRMSGLWPRTARRLGRCRRPRPPPSSRAGPRAHDGGHRGSSWSSTRTNRTLSSSGIPTSTRLWLVWKAGSSAVKGAHGAVLVPAPGGSWRPR